MTRQLIFNYFSLLSNFYFILNILKPFQMYFTGFNNNLVTGCGIIEIYNHLPKWRSKLIFLHLISLAIRDLLQDNWLSVALI